MVILRARSAECTCFSRFHRRGWILPSRVRFHAENHAILSKYIPGKYVFVLLLIASKLLCKEAITKSRPPPRFFTNAKFLLLLTLRSIQQYLCRGYYCSLNKNNTPPLPPIRPLSQVFIFVAIITAVIACTIVLAVYHTLGTNASFRY